MDFSYSLYLRQKSCCLPLDALDEKIVLLARDVVGAHDAALEARGDGTSEHTSKGVEATFVVGGYHL